MTMSLDDAAQVMREAMRETVKRHSLWYLVQAPATDGHGRVRLHFHNANMEGVRE
jgi:hypothetical protein